MSANAAGKMLVLGLNEFNKELLCRAARALGLRNLQRVVSLPETATRTDDTYESNYLEPWVQWVSVHTGTPAAEHRIKHLGDVPDLGTPQIWEELSRRGVTSGVWGAMNAGRGGADQCRFFLPDPWTFSERAFPEELNRLLDLPRYVAKNYLNLSKARAVGLFLRLLTLFGTPRLAGSLLGAFPGFLRDLIRHRGAHFVFISFTELMLGTLFLEYRRRHDPRFSMIFLNTLAHLQHHHWHGPDVENNAPMALGLRYLDRLVGRLLGQLGPGDVFICLNALSQKNTNDEKPWILYRQRDQSQFLEAAGIRFARVEPHMTYDAHILFDSAEDCLSAQRQLRDARIAGGPLFLVEDYASDPLKLFYRVDFSDPVETGTTFSINGRVLDFGELFQAIVTRTGRHIPEGTLYCSDGRLPKTMFNHELFGEIVGFFREPAAAAAPA